MGSTIRGFGLRAVPGEGAVFRILTVCTGNVCRSAFSAVVLRDRLAGFPVEVVSAGTRSERGNRIDPLAAEVARAWGVSEVSWHRARDLRAADAEGAGLVLAAEREHRRRVVEEAPSATRRTFTFREFARLASSLSDAELRSAVSQALVPSADSVSSGEASSDEAGAFAARMGVLVAAVGAHRGVAVPPSDPADDDVADPWSLGREAFVRMGEELRGGLDQVVRLVRLAAAS